MKRFQKILYDTDTDILVIGKYLTWNISVLFLKASSASLQNVELKRKTKRFRFICWSLNVL